MCIFIGHVLVFLAMILPQIHHVNWLRNFGLAVQWSYSKQLFWWSGVELSRRLAFLTLAIIPVIHTVESIDTWAGYHCHYMCKSTHVCVYGSCLHPKYKLYSVSII